MPRALILACLTLLLSLCGTGRAQNSAPPAPLLPLTATSSQTSLLPSPPAADADQPPPTTLDLLVRDRKGRPVLDLKPADIAITDGGKIVKLTSLRPIQAGDARDRLVTFVFGQMDTSSAKNARGIALTMLKAFPDRGYAFAVLGVNGRLRLFSPYTANRGALQQAVNTLTTAQPAAWQAAFAAQEKTLIALADEAPDTSLPGETDLARTRAHVLLTSLRQSQQLVIDQHLLPDLAGINALSKAQQELPGRKAIVYFGQSTQTDVNTLDQFHAAIHAANQAAVSIYAIDMNALDLGASDAMQASISMGAATSSANQNHAPGAAASGLHSLLGPMSTQAVSDNINNLEIENSKGAESALASLAVQTGGRFTGFNDGVKKVTKQLVSDMNHYYQASYVSPAELYDGSFRTITVKALRRGLTIHAPPGYFALPRSEEAAASTLDASLSSLFEHPDTAADLSYRATALHFEQTAKGEISEFVVEVPMDAIDIREDPNADLYAYHLKVAARVEKTDGKVVQEFSEDLHHRGSLDALDADRTGAVTFQRHAVLPAGRYKLVTALVDVNSGKSGISTQAFEVASAPARRLLSDLVLVRREEHSPSPAELGEINRDPLQYGAAEIVPDLSGAVTAATRDATIFFTTSSRQPGAATALVTVSIAKDGQQFGQWTLHGIPASPGSAPSAAASSTSGTAYISTFAFNTLPPGRYDVTARITEDKVNEERHLVLEQPGPANATAAATNSAAPILRTDLVTIADPASLLATSRAPAPAMAEEWIAAARKRALGYQGKLPNFLCLETIERFTDRSGKGHYTHRDTTSEMLTYRDRKESRTVLEINGRRPDADHRDIRGPRSNGEFGGLLQAIFDPAVDAHFAWQGETQTAGSPLQVFRYQVAQKKSTFSLTDSNQWNMNVAIRGLVSIEPATGAVRSVTVQAEELPAGFSIHASSAAVDYDYVAINHHDYLVPVRGEVTLQEGRHEAHLNQFQFRDYHRFTAQSRILSYQPVDIPK